MNKQQQLMKKLLEEKNKKNNAIKGDKKRPNRKFDKTKTKVNPRLGKDNGGGLYS